MKTNLVKGKSIDAIDGSFMCGRIDIIAFSNPKNQYIVKSKLDDFSNLYDNLYYDVESTIHKNKNIDRINLELANTFLDDKFIGGYNFVSYLTSIHDRICNIEHVIKDYILDEYIKHANVFISIYVKDLFKYRNQIKRQLVDNGYFKSNIESDKYMARVDNVIVSVAFELNSININALVSDLSPRGISTLYTQAALLLCKIYGKNINSLNIIK